MESGDNPEFSSVLAPAQLSPQCLLDNGSNNFNESHSTESSSKSTYTSVFTTSQSSPESLKSDGINNGGDTDIKVQKSPRRILHFSDGTLEEYSTDEEDEVDTSRVISTVNPKTLPWGSWVWYQTTAVGSVSLRVCDYLGETLANFFGITTPKYQYEIDEYNRMIAEEEEDKKKEDMEMQGWKEDSTSADIIHTSQISAVDETKHDQGNDESPANDAQRY